MHHLQPWTGPPARDETRRGPGDLVGTLPSPPNPGLKSCPRAVSHAGVESRYWPFSHIRRCSCSSCVTGMRPARKNVAHHQQDGSYQQYRDEIMIKICVVHMHSDYYLTIPRQMMRRKHVLLFGMISCVSSHTNMHQIVELATHGNLQKRNFWVDEKVDDFHVSTLVIH